MNSLNILIFFCNFFKKFSSRKIYKYFYHFLCTVFATCCINLSNFYYKMLCKFLFKKKNYLQNQFSFVYLQLIETICGSNVCQFMCKLFSKMLGIFVVQNYIHLQTFSNFAKTCCWGSFAIAYALKVALLIVLLSLLRQNRWNQ